MDKKTFTKPLTFIDIFNPKTRRQSSLSAYGKRDEGLLHVLGNLEHQDGIEPATVQDADKLISWLQEWKEKHQGKVDVSQDGPVEIKM